MPEIVSNLLDVCSLNDLEAVKNVLSTAENLEQEYSFVNELDGGTSIIEACKNGNVDIVRELLKPEHCKFFISKVIDKKDEEGQTALTKACIKGSLEIVSLLLKSEAGICIEDDNEKTPIEYAIEGGSEAIILKLLEEAKEQIREFDNRNFRKILDFLIKNKKIKYVLYLLKDTDLINIELDLLAKVLLLASKEGSEEIVQLIINNVHLDTQDNNQNTALILASKANNTKIAKILISRGADVILENSEKETALSIAKGNALIKNVYFELLQDDECLLLQKAIKTEQIEFIKFLLEIMKENNINFENTYKDILKYTLNGCLEERTDILQALLEHDKANLEIEDEEGNTPLLIASKKGWVDSVELFINNNANLNHKNKEEQNSLLIALKEGYLKVAEVLMKHGMKLEDLKVEEVRSIIDFTSIYMNSGEQNNVTIVKTLIDSGLIAMNHKKDKRTCLDVAIDSESYDVVRYFLVEKKFLKPKEKKSLKKLVFIASKRGDVEFLEYLIVNFKINLDAKDKEGKTALQLAILAKEYKAAICLIEKKASVNSKSLSSMEETPLMCVALAGVEENTNEGQKKAIDLLLARKAKVDEVDALGKSPLIYAIEAKNTYLIKKLLEKGANINCCDKQNKSVLRYALDTKDDQVIALISNCKDIEIDKKKNPVQDKDSNTVIMSAVEANSIKVLEFLLANEEVKDCIDVLGSKGKTALQIAIENQDILAVEKLIKAGANVNTRDAQEKSTLSYAIESRNKKILESVLSSKSFKLRLITCKDQSSFLHTAILSNSDIEIARFLVDRGVVNVEQLINQDIELLDKILESKNLKNINFILEQVSKFKNINIVIKGKYTILSYICKIFNKETVSFLLKLGIDVDMKGRSQVTPLMVACEENRKGIVDLLLTSGADPNLEDEHGNLAIDFAIKSNFIGIVNLLLERVPNIKTSNLQKKTLLMTALSISDFQGLEIMRCLLEKTSVDINSVDGEGVTVLEKLLMKVNQGDFDVRDPDMVGRYFQILEFLMSKGARISDYSQTSLNKYLEVIGSVLSQTAKSDNADYANVVAYANIVALAIEYNCFSIIKNVAETELNIFERLIKEDKINITDIIKLSLFRKDLSILKLLTVKDSIVKISSENQFKALLKVALENRDVNFLNFLQEKTDFSINLQDEEISNFIVNEVKEGKLKIVQFLLDNKICIDRESNIYIEFLNAIIQRGYDDDEILIPLLEQSKKGVLGNKTSGFIVQIAQEAFKKGYKKILHAIIRYNPEILKKKSLNVSLFDSFLKGASGDGYLEIVDLLTSYELNIEYSYLVECLKTAIGKGHKDIATKLYKLAENFKNSSPSKFLKRPLENQLLNKSLGDQQYHIAKCYQQNLSLRSDNPKTELVFAIQEGKIENFLEFVEKSEIKKKELLEYKIATGDTILMLLSRYSNADNMGAFLTLYNVKNSQREISRFNKYLDQVNNSKETALIIACKNSKPKNVRWLLEQGAGFNRQDSSGKTALDIIKSNDILKEDIKKDPDGFLSLAIAINSIELLRFLFEIGIDLEYERSELIISSLVATDFYNPEIVKLLFQKGLLLAKAKKRQNEMFLQKALMNNDFQTVKLLMKQEVKIDLSEQTLFLIPLLDRTASPDVKYECLDQLFFILLSGCYIDRIEAIFLEKIFIEACKLPHKAIVRFLIDKKFEKNFLMLENSNIETQEAEKSVLEILCNNKSLDLILYLLKREPELSLGKELCNRIFVLAINLNDIQAVEYLSVNTKVDLSSLKQTSDNEENRAITIKRDIVDNKILQTLIEKNKEIGAQICSVYVSSLSKSIESSPLAERDKYKKNLEIVNAKGTTLLITAAKEGLEESISLLLQHVSKEYITTSDEEGKTALDCAVIYALDSKGKFESIEALIKADTREIQILKKWRSYYEDLLFKASEYNNSYIVNFLVSKGVDINAKRDINLSIALEDSEGSTPSLITERTKNFKDVSPIGVAIAKGSIPVCQILLDKGAEISDQESESLFLLAAEKDSKEIVESLISKGQYIGVVDKSGQTAIMKAIIGGASIDTIKELLLINRRISNQSVILSKEDQEGAQEFQEICSMKFKKLRNLSLKDLILKKLVLILNKKDNNGRTAATHAVLNQNLDALKFLYKRESSIVEKDVDGKNTFMHAVNGGNPDIIASLRSRKDVLSSLEDQDREGKNSLIHAVLSQDIDTVKWLSKKVNVFMSDFSRKTAIMHAVEVLGNSDESQETSRDILNVLLENITEDMKVKIALQAKDNEGNTPLMKLIILKQKDPQLVKCFLEKGASVDVQNNNKKTSIILALEEDNFDAEIFQSLVDYSVDLESKDLEGNTALLCAVKANNDKAVEIILGTKQFNIDAINKKGQTAAMLAAFLGNSAILMNLLKLGARVDLADKDKKTVLNYSLESGYNSEILKILLKNKDIKLLLESMLGGEILDAALTFEDDKVIELLLSREVNLNIYGNKVAKIIQYAISHDSTEIMIVLINKGLNPYVPNLLGEMIEGESVNIFSYLTSEEVLGDDKKILDKQDSNGNTAVMHALQHKKDQFFQDLVNMGVDLTIADYEGSTVLTKAIQLGNKEKVNILLEKVDLDSKSLNLLVDRCERGEQEFIDIVEKIILNAPEKICIEGNYLYRIFLVLIQHNKSKAVLDLITQGIDIDRCFEKSESSQHPLSYAAQHKDLTIFKILLLEKINLDTVKIFIGEKEFSFIEFIEKERDNFNDYEHLVFEENVHNFSLLIIASRSGSYEVVKFLLNQKVNLGYQDIDGKTGLMHALENGYEDIVNHLFKDKKEQVKLEKQKIEQDIALSEQQVEEFSKEVKEVISETGINSNNYEEITKNFEDEKQKIEELINENKTKEEKYSRLNQRIEFLKINRFLVELLIQELEKQVQKADFSYKDRGKLEFDFFKSKSGTRGLIPVMELRKEGEFLIEKVKRYNIALDMKQGHKEVFHNGYGEDLIKKLSGEGAEGQSIKKALSFLSGIVGGSRGKLTDEENSKLKPLEDRKLELGKGIEKEELSVSEILEFMEKSKKEISELKQKNDVIEKNLFDYKQKVLSKDIEIQKLENQIKDLKEEIGRVELELANLNIVSINDVCEEGQTSLHFACLSGNLELIKQIAELISQSINTPDKKGRTPLEYVSVLGNCEAIKILIEKGAKLNGINPISENANLQVAVLNKQFAACKMLLELGANSYIEFAKEELRKCILVEERGDGSFNVQSVKIPKQGVDISFIDDLLQKYTEGDYSYNFLTRILTNHKQKFKNCINQQDEQNQTILMRLVEQEQVKIFGLILEEYKDYLDLEIKDNNQKTFLDLLCERTFSENTIKMIGFLPTKKFHIFSRNASENANPQTIIELMYTNFAQSTEIIQKEAICAGLKDLVLKGNYNHIKDKNTFLQKIVKDGAFEFMSALLDRMNKSERLEVLKSVWEESLNVILKGEGSRIVDVLAIFKHCYDLVNEDMTEALHREAQEGCWHKFTLSNLNDAFSILKNVVELSANSPEYGNFVIELYLKISQEFPALSKDKKKTLELLDSAIKANNCNFVKCLLVSNTAINIKQSKANEIILLASKQDDFSLIADIQKLKKINSLNKIKDKEGRNVLIIAVLNDSEEVIRGLLEDESSITNLIEEKDNHGNNAVYYAIQKNKLQIIEMALHKECKMNIDFIDDKGRNFLIAMVSGYQLDTTPEQHQDRLQYIFHILENQNADRKIDCGLQDKEGKTALMYAIEYNQLDFISKLRSISEDIGINKKDKDGNTALHQAINQKKFDIVLSLLDIRDINLEMLDSKGLNAFFKLCSLEVRSEEDERKILNIVNHFLLNSQVNINMIYEGKTALRNASEKKRMKVVQSILKKGLKLNEEELLASIPEEDILTDANTRECFKDVNVEKKHTLAMYQSAVGNINFLSRFFNLFDEEEKILHINQETVSGDTALNFAINFNQVESVFYLLNQGIQLDNENSLGYNPLMCAVASHNGKIQQRIEIINALLSREQDYVNQRNSEVDEDSLLTGLMTPLIVACKEDADLRIIQILLEQGAEVNSKDQQGNRAIKYLIDSCKRLSFYSSKIEAIKYLVMNNKSYLKTSEFLDVFLCASMYKGEEFVNYLLSEELLLEREGGEIVRFTTDLFKEIAQGVYDISDEYSQTILMHLCRNGHNKAVNIILENFAYREVKDRNQKTDLFYAVEGHNLGAATELLKKNVQVSKKDNKGQTVIDVALEEISKNIHIIELLFSQEDIDEALTLDNKKGDRAEIFYNLAVEAIIIQKIGLLKILIKKELIDVKQDSLLLFTAAKKAQTTVFQLLIENGANINTFDNEYAQNTVLMQAVLMQSCAFVDWLLSQPEIDIEAANSKKSTALSMAALTNNPNLVKLLLKHGANKEHKDEQGNTPVMIACQQGCLQSLKVLCEAGAQMQVTNDLGKTPLILTLENGHTKVVDYVLQKPNNNIFEKDSNGNTALSIMCRKGDQSAEKILSNDNKIKVENYLKKTNTFWSVLREACMSTNANIVKALLSFEDCNWKEEEKDKDGNTVLHIASAHSNLEIFQLLLNEIEDLPSYISDRNNEGNTPFMEAYIHKNKEVLDMLKGLLGIDLSISQERKVANLNKSDVISSVNSITAFYLGLENNIFSTEEVNKLLEDSIIEGSIFVNSLLISLQENRKDILEVLTEVDNSLFEITDEFSEILDFACKIGYVKVLEILLNKDREKLKRLIKINHLEMICSIGHEKALQFLLDNQLLDNQFFIASVPVQEDGSEYEHSEGFLSLASKNGHSEIVKKLLLSHDFSLEEVKKAFQGACYNRHLSIVKLFLEKNKFKERIFKEIAPVILLQVSGKGYFEIVEYLLSFDKISLKIATKETGITPITYAAYYGHDKVVEVLLKKGVNVHCRDVNENSALSMFARQGKVKAVKKLIDYGAMDDRLNCSIALRAVIENNYMNIARLLLSSRKDISYIDDRDSSGYTALTAAIVLGNFDMVKLLLKNGAKINKPYIDPVTKQSFTPMFLAKTGDYRDIVNLLSSRGGVRRGIASKEIGTNNNYSNKSYKDSVRKTPCKDSIPQIGF